MEFQDWIGPVSLILVAIAGAVIRGEFRSRENKQRIEMEGKSTGAKMDSLEKVTKEIHDKVDQLQQDVAYMKGREDIDPGP